MNVASRKFMTFGSAVMTLCLGLPFAAQAGSSFDSTGDRYRYGSPYRDKGSHADSWDRGYNNRGYYTDQYGDLDTVQDQETDKRDRSVGYWTQEGYRSNVSTQNPRYPNDLRRADETIRQDIIDELGEGTERVRVTVRNGVATLTGMVLNREAMVAAVEDAYAGGAGKVRNRLEIFRHEERPWAEMSDRNLERAVREELSWSPYVDEDPIRVSVRQGVVTLQGSVEDRTEMAAAVENAYEAGARRVNNQLRILN